MSFWLDKKKICRMIKILIAFDDQDSDLGVFFTSCKDDLVQHANYCGIDDIVCFDGNSATHNLLPDQISSLDEAPFIFISYTHGQTDAILLNSIPIVNLSSAYFFGSSLFYACACKSGDELGKHLVENENCHAFIGFKDDAMLGSVEDYDSVFMECENFGIKHFLNGQTTIKESFEAMKEFYTEKIDELTYTAGALTAGYLLDNRNALILLPEDSQCRLSDFY